MNKNIDLRTLIEQCTEYLRDAGFSESSVFTFNRYLSNGLLPFAESRGICYYSNDLGNDYLDKLKRDGTITSARKKSLFMFHSYVCRGIVILRKSYKNEQHLDDFSIVLPTVDYSENRIPLDDIVKLGTAFLKSNNYCIDVVNRYTRIWELGLYPFLKHLGYDFYAVKLGILFSSVYSPKPIKHDRTKSALKILDSIVNQDVCLRGNSGMYERASLMNIVNGIDLQQQDAINTIEGEKKIPIEKIIEECITLLQSLCYSKDVIERNKKIWEKGLIPFAQKYNIHDYSKSIGIAFKNVIAPLYKGNTRRLDRSIYILDCYLEHGTILYTKNQESEDITHESPLWKKAEAFFEDLRHNARKDSTIIMYKKDIHRFISHLHQNGIVSFEDVTDEMLLHFIEGQKERRHLISSLRVFALFLFYNGFVSRDFGYCIKRDGFVSGEKLPSVYSSEEVSTIEKSINQASAMGKRDYAMILLMSRLGMRTSDVCQLKFSNLDWDHNRIRFVQFKTGNPLELPLLKDVGEAIINYIKYGRPKSDLPYIFLTAHSPYREISRYSSSVQKIITDSGVNVNGRKHGTHSLRHSLASQMLANGVPLPIISASLGHSNTQTTMDYLRIDTKQLIKCELDVPCVDQNFFMQTEKQSKVYE